MKMQSHTFSSKSKPSKLCKIRESLNTNQVVHQRGRDNIAKKI
ncbi:hypothetical protein SLEP1_g47632 [Rubroshorea leprosula]|uniref:Uncharacterized protein n=1 Tax=Rubroshorea leprosula TaxID=152421 RepID=A0AAV5LR45_9ROSI|nr:hypothetical protein SLEP1_g47632 [Rubroshorea leprosula]